MSRVEDFRFSIEICRDVAFPLSWIYLHFMHHNQQWQADMELVEVDSPIKQEINPLAGDINMLAGVLFQGDSFEFGPETLPAIYPESLLLQTPQGNKYYGSFQSYNKQFIGGTSTGSIVRWANSSIESNQRRIVGKWLGTELKPSISSDLHSSTKKHTGSRSTANALFSWSSGDSYIAARKRELQAEMGLERPDTPGSGDEPPNPDSSVSTAPVESAQNKLNRIIEMESNKFIHARIQLIKAHHSDQINKQIHERKRKDHEAHLSKLRIKEAEYDAQLEAALADQNLNKQGFLGSLFGFSSVASGIPTSELKDELDTTTGTIDGNSTPNRNKRYSFLPVNALWSTSKDLREEETEKDKKENIKEESIKDGNDLKEDPKQNSLDSKELKGSKDQRNSKDSQDSQDSSYPNTPKPMTSRELASANKDIIPETEELNESDDEFEDFSSAAPIQEIIHPETKATTTDHKFIPLQTQNSHEINQDLIDIFGPSTQPHNKKHSKDEDLLSF